MLGKALFLDRDGIFNELVLRDGAYHSPRNWNEVTHYNLEGLGHFKSLGFQLIMVTNQPDIERKIIDSTFIDELHRYYQERYSLDKIYVCPFSSNDHPLKKPNPGMFFLAQKEFQLDLSHCFILGDTEKDTLAARRCGMKSILWNRNYNQGVKADFTVDSISSLQQLFCRLIDPASI
jgi:histidinol-phosphate phosphatase family protein